MIKNSFLLILFFLIIQNLYAERKIDISTGTLLPGIGQFTSETVYYASFTCVASNLDTVKISTHPALLFSISISSGGIGNPFVEVFDARHATGTNSGIAAGVRQIGRIDSRENRDHRYQIGLSSGLAVSNQGSTPACLSIIYTTW